MPVQNPIDELPGDGGGGDGGGGGSGGGYVPPVYDSGDWAKIAGFPAGRTEYRSVNLARLLAGSSDLNGVYTVLTVSNDHIVLSNPALVNPNWDAIETATGYTSPTLSTSGERWIGPYIVESSETTRLLANFVGLNGLYKDDGKNQTAFPIQVQIEATPVNSDDDPIGAPETFSIILPGNINDRSTRAVSLWGSLSVPGRVAVRARRLTPSDLSFKGTVVDEVKWRDLFGVTDVGVEDFGDVTTVHTRTYATNSALSVKDRQLNMLATRKLPRRVSGSTFTTALYATNNIADIFSAVALDPTIGGRAPEEVDFDSIYDTIAAVEAYFGTPDAVEMGYTIDSNNLSSEETMALIAQIAFCTAYRQGRVIRMSFERATEDSVLLFNHRNVIPDSQQRSVRFGVLNDQDGVELDYTDTEANTITTFHVPLNGVPVNPRGLEVPGIRSTRLAYWQSWRAWNRMRYQNIAVELEATQEAGLVIRNDRILISDMTRPERIDGEVEEQDGTVLILSNPAPLAVEQNWTIFLQHIDATVEALGVTRWTPGAGEDEDDRKVVVSAVPRMPLATDDALALGGAKYTIVAEGDPQHRAFLVSSREPQSDFTETVQAVNYSFLYYQNDQLLLWLDFDDGYLDASAWQRDGIGTGGTLVQDSDRGVRVFNGTGAGSVITIAGLTAPASYSKSFWVRRADLTGTVLFLSSATESVALTPTPGVTINHGGSAVSAPWVAGTGAWEHVAATFDADQMLATIYIGGKKAGAGTLPPRTLSALSAIGLDGANGLNGRAEDIRVYPRALTATEVRAIYKATRR